MKKHWKGNAQTLIEKLEKVATIHGVDPKRLPKGVAQMGKALRQSAVILKHFDVNIDFPRTGRGRNIVINKR